VEDDDDDMEIDLENPDDVKIIEQEFLNLYNSDEQFRQSFGEEALDLEPLQKYHIIDTYNKHGFEAVLALLINSADQSGILKQMDANGQSDIMGEMGGQQEESVIEHNGKKYTRI
jgi:hypothetical protein